eukprot:1150372-Pelagomonas_calceolata.AAC.1
MKGIPGIWKCNVRGVWCEERSNTFEMAWMSSAWRWVLMRIGQVSEPGASSNPPDPHQHFLFAALRLRGAWNADAMAEDGEHTNKLAKYHHWMAFPFKPLPVHGAPFSVPRYLHLDLGKHELRNVARFHLHAHTLVRALRIETSLWQEHTCECDRCDQGGLQDEKHAVFLCFCEPMCSLPFPSPPYTA